MSQDLQLTPGTLPGGIEYCFSNFQQLNVDIVTQINGQLRGGASFYNLGETEPQPDFRGFPWFKPSTGYWWKWDFGFWVRPHPDLASSDVRRIFVGTFAAIQTYDGGDTSALGDATGPMWEEDTAMRARFPLGAGNLPSGAVIANTTTGGQEKVSLLITELPSHNHDLWVGSSDGSAASHREAIQTVNSPHSGTTAAYLQTGDNAGDPLYMKKLGDNTAHDNMPPYYGVYFIKRTTRGWYRM